MATLNVQNRPVNFLAIDAEISQQFTYFYKLIGQKSKEVDKFPTFGFKNILEQDYHENEPFTN